MKRLSKKLALVAGLAAGLAFAAPACADQIILEPPRTVIQSPDTRPRQMELIIKDHRFEPAEFRLLPQERIILRVINKDESAEEFKSLYLRRRKIIPGKSQVDIPIGPLKPGVYEFWGMYHTETAYGRITVPQLGWNYNNQQ